MHQDGDGELPANLDYVSRSVYVNAVVISGVAPDTGLSCRMDESLAAFGCGQQGRNFSDIALPCANALRFQLGCRAALKGGDLMALRGKLATD
jgi:hypothetical protein